MVCHILSGTAHGGLPGDARGGDDGVARELDDDEASRGEILAHFARRGYGEGDGTYTYVAREGRGRLVIGSDLYF